MSAALDVTYSAQELLFDASPGLNEQIMGSFGGGIVGGGGIGLAVWIGEILSRSPADTLSRSGSQDQRPRMRLQIQGEARINRGRTYSVALYGVDDHVSVALALAGLRELQSSLPRQLRRETISGFRTAEQFISTAPTRGGLRDLPNAFVNHPQYINGYSPRDLRLDIENRGINLRF